MPPINIFNAYKAHHDILLKFHQKPDGLPRSIRVALCDIDFHYLKYLTFWKVKIHKFEVAKNAYKMFHFMEACICKQDVVQSLDYIEKC